MHHDTIKRLLDLMATLRSPEGCPWDREQTAQSLKPYLLEESHELLEALDRGNPKEICEELGDLLLQVVFLSRIFEEEGEFSFADVAGAIAEKLIRRHPHVFGDLEEDDLAALHRNWEQIKASEKDPSTEGAIFNAIPKTLPALARAQKVIGKAHRYGLNPEGTSVAPQGTQLQKALDEDDRQPAEELIGQHLLSIANLCQHHHLDAESALRRETDRLIRTLRTFEAGLSHQGRTLNDVPPEELNRLWQSSPKTGEIKKDK